MAAQIPFSQLPRDLKRKLKPPRGRRVKPVAAKADSTPTVATGDQTWRRCPKGCTTVMNGPKRCDRCGARMRPR